MSLNLIYKSSPIQKNAFIVFHFGVTREKHCFKSICRSALKPRVVCFIGWFNQLIILNITDKLIVLSL